MLYHSFCLSLLPGWINLPVVHQVCTEWWPQTTGFWKWQLIKCSWYTWGMLCSPWRAATPPMAQYLLLLPRPSSWPSRSCLSGRECMLSPSGMEETGFCWFVLLLWVISVIFSCFVSFLPSRQARGRLLGFSIRWLEWPFFTQLCYYHIHVFTASTISPGPSVYIVSFLWGSELIVFWSTWKLKTGDSHNGQLS